MMASDIATKHSFQRHVPIAGKRYARKLIQPNAVMMKMIAPIMKIVVICLPPA